MKCFKLIKYDINNGIFGRIYSYMGIIAVSIIFFIDFYFQIRIYKQELVIENQPVTITNCLFYIFKGLEPFKPDLTSEFIFPVMWMILFLLISYLTLDYPLGNLTGHGMQIITRIENRRKWWLSKCIWVIESTIICFVLLYITLAVLCIIFGFDISFKYSDYVNNTIFNMIFLNKIHANEIILLILILPVLTAITINLIQLCLGLFIKKIYCFAITAIILFVSAYYNTPVMIGNFAMVKRSSLCTINGVTYMQGIIINGTIAILAVMAGLLRFRKYDILKEDM